SPAECSSGAPSLLPREAAAALNARGGPKALVSTLPILSALTPKIEYLSGWRKFELAARARKRKMDVPGEISRLKSNYKGGMPCRSYQADPLGAPLAVQFY